MTSKTYYGPQTHQALENFPFPLPLASLEFISAIVEIKKAAAVANSLSGQLDNTRAKLIVKACDEVLAGKHDAQFVTNSLQGGAGTSINMNVNEVIAARAEEIGNEGLDIHPNDHVNMSQSTNDVNPSALRIVCLRLIEKLDLSVGSLVSALESKAQEFSHVLKLARTHLQDAIPTTLGAEFAAYAAIVQRDLRRIEQTRTYLVELNLGGTAVGNSLNASGKYIEKVYEELEKMTVLPIKKAKNLMALTSSTTDFCQLSTALNMLCLDLSKIATDLRILSSGPRGGLGEISLEALQPGSSIMPGKVNPVMAESINQVYYFVSGKNLTIHQASEGAVLELAIMFPVLADALISSLKLVDSAVILFNKKCVSTIQANPARCQELLENSTAYATVLSPQLGYETMSAIVKESLAKKKSIRQLILDKQLMTAAQLEQALG